MHNEALAMIMTHLPAMTSHGMAHMMTAMQRLMDAVNPGMSHMMTGGHPQYLQLKTTSV